MFKNPCGSMSQETPGTAASQDSRIKSAGPKRAVAVVVQAGSPNVTAVLIDLMSGGELFPEVGDASLMNGSLIRGQLVERASGVKPLPLDPLGHTLSVAHVEAAGDGAGVH